MDEVLGLYDSGRLKTGTHGNVKAWAQEVLDKQGLMGLQSAISHWGDSWFVGDTGIFCKVREWESICFVPLEGITHA